jgi:hypothetical protein
MLKYGQEFEFHHSIDNVAEADDGTDGPPNTNLMTDVSFKS